MTLCTRKVDIKQGQALSRLGCRHAVHPLVPSTAGAAAPPCSTPILLWWAGRAPTMPSCLRVCKQTGCETLAEAPRRHPGGRRGLHGEHGSHAGVRAQRSGSWAHLRACTPWPRSPRRRWRSRRTCLHASAGRQLSTDNFVSQAGGRVLRSPAGDSQTAVSVSPRVPPPHVTTSRAPVSGKACRTWWNPGKEVRVRFQSAQRQQLGSPWSGQQAECAGAVR